MKRYYCKHCGQTVLRKSDKAWIKSFCVIVGKDVRIVRKK